MSAAVRQLVDAVLGGVPDHGTPPRCADPRADSDCGCGGCAVLRHLAKATCWFSDCGKPARYRMTRWWHRGTIRQAADPGDPHADAEGLVEMPCHPRSTEFDQFYVCGTVHARRVLNANREFATPQLGPIVTTWGVQRYHWPLVEDALPEACAALFEDGDLLSRSLHAFATASSAGDRARAARSAADLTTALTKTLYHAHRLSHLQENR